MRVQRNIAIRNSVVVSTSSGNSNTFSAGSIPYGLSGAGESTSLSGVDPVFSAISHTFGWFSVPYFPNVGLDMWMGFEAASPSVAVGGVDYDVWVELLDEGRANVVATSQIVNVPATYLSVVVRITWNVGAFLTEGLSPDRLFLIRFVVNSTDDSTGFIGFLAGQMWIDTPTGPDIGVIAWGSP